MVEILNSSNIIALVGGGTYPNSSLSKVIVYDVQLAKEVGVLRFGSPIQSVKLCYDK